MIRIPFDIKIAFIDNRPNESCAKEARVMKLTLDIPITIKEFEILALLDSGSMADVYLAHSIKSSTDGQLVVLKVLKEKFRDEPEIGAMFLDEARLLERISHPNVVRYLESGSIDSRPYIVMEYPAGDNLTVLVKTAKRQGERISVSVITRICIQVANALDYIHNLKDEQGKSLNLVHRDISPQNILVTYDGRIKLLDFGIALTEDRSVVTRTGLLKGKLRYMSPEQIESKDMDARSDLFSMGIVMWELLANRKLFKADSEFKTVKKICEEPIASPAQYRQNIPVSLETIVMGLLRRDPEKRYQTAAQLRTALMDVLRQDFPHSRPDEISKTIESLLSDRKEKKEAATNSISPSGKENLFSDIDPDDDAASSSSVQKDFTGAMAPLAARENQSSGDKPIKRKRKALLWLGAAIVISLGLVSIAGLLMTINGDVPPSAKTLHVSSPAAPDAGRAVPDRRNTPDSIVLNAHLNSDGGAQPAADSSSSTKFADVHDGGEQQDRTDGRNKQDSMNHANDTGQSDQDEKTVFGFLILKTEPETRVFVGDEYVGQTPVTEMELKPGKYNVTMKNIQAGIEKKVRIVIRPGEVTALQYIF